MIILGATFPIIEEDLKQVMKARMANMDPAVVRQKIQEQIKHAVRHPKPIFTNAACKDYRTWTYDPTATLDRDIIDAKGNVLTKKGATYNPLHHHTLSIQLVFIEGTVPAQVAWALKQPKAKIVLVNGSPLTLEEQHQTPIYFDQGGHLCRQFGISAFPARVYQEAFHLRCEEIVVSTPIC